MYDLFCLFNLSCILMFCYYSFSNNFEKNVTEMKSVPLSWGTSIIWQFNFSYNLICVTPDCLSVHNSVESCQNWWFKVLDNLINHHTKWTFIWMCLNGSSKHCRFGHFPLLNYIKIICLATIPANAALL